MTNAPTTPDDIQGLEAQWKGWLDHLEVRIALPRDLLPCDMQHASSASPIDAADAVVKMFTITVRLTTAHLTHGGNLQIDDGPYKARFCGPLVTLTGRDGYYRDRDVDDMEHITRARTFSPVALYHAIVADYSGDCVRRVERQAAAEALHSAFSLGDAPMKTRAGCVVLTVPMRGETSKGSSRINYGFCGQRAKTAAYHLVGTLASYLDRRGYLPGAQIGFDSAVGYNFKGVVESRERMPLTPDVTAVFYRNKIEFLIAADVAAGLNAFLGEWLGEAA